MKVTLVLVLLFVVAAGFCRAGLPKELCYDNIESKIVGFKLNVTYKAYFGRKDFKSASAECAKKEGHLVTIASVDVMTLIETKLFGINIVQDSGPKFFWMGLSWDDDKKWQFDGGNPPNWRGTSKYVNFDDDPKPHLDNLDCVGLLLQEDGDFKWHREECSHEAAFICEEPSKMLYPSEVSGQTGLYICSENEPYNTKTYAETTRDCDAQHGEHKVDINVRMCSATHFWDIIVCVPGCQVEGVEPDVAAVPTNSVLLDPIQSYYVGSTVPYYCPGFFTYGSEDKVLTESHTIHVPCLSHGQFTQAVKNLKCHARDVTGYIKSDRPILHAAHAHDYALRCNHEGYPEIKASQYAWYHGGRELSPSGKSLKEGHSFDLDEENLLVIKHLTEDAGGVYACFGRVKHVYLPGNVYNVSVEHYKAAEEALQNWNDVDEKNLGYFVDYSGTILSHVAEPKEEASFDDADQLCQKTGVGGRLAKLLTNSSFARLENLFSPEINPDFRFKSDLKKEYPNFFWIGLKFNTANNKWEDLNGELLSIPLPWDTEHPDHRKHYLCAGAVLDENGGVKLRKGDCNQKEAFVCSVYTNSTCKPSDVTKEAEDSNFYCTPGKTYTQVESKECKCSPDETQIVLPDHSSCSGNNNWTTNVCLPKCSDDHGEHGILVQPEDEYYTGMYMTYFCAGHFEVNGNIYHQNSLPLVCDPFRQEVVNVRCDDGDILEENYNVHIVRVDFETTAKISLALNCSAFPDKNGKILWVKDGRTIDGANSATLDVLVESPENIGVYMCFNELHDVLTPGSVHKITEEREDDSAASDATRAFQRILLVVMPLLLSVYGGFSFLFALW